jgi:hypothetical protein
VSNVLLRLSEAHQNSEIHDQDRREEHGVVTERLNEQQVLLERILDAVLEKKEVSNHVSCGDPEPDVLIGIPPPAQDLPEYARFPEARLSSSRAPPPFSYKYHHREPIYCPVTLLQLVGRLVVRYSCVPDLVANCYDPDCKKGDPDHARRKALCFMYYFPTWLCTRRILGRFVYSSVSGPEFLLRVPNIVPSNSDVLNFARTGNVRGLQYLFTNGLASPYDANSCGLTALHVSPGIYPSASLHILIL